MRRPPNPRSMENRRQRRRRPISATKRPRRSPPNPATVLAATLAVVATHRTPTPSTLTDLRRLLLLSPSPLSPSHLSLTISILPSVLSEPSTAIIGLRIVSAAALSSFEANEMIARDEEVVRAVVRKVGSGERSVVMAACDAVMDMGVSVEGRRRLIEVNGLVYLMIGFIKVYDASKLSISVSSADKVDVAYLGVENSEDELLMFLLSAVVTLINSCNVEQLEGMPKKLVKTVVIYFKQLWAQVRKQILAEKDTNMCQARHVCLRNLTASSFTESVFRLSINAPDPACVESSEVMVRQIFGSSNSSFMNFLLNHWESSIFLLRRPTRSLNEEEDIFSSFKKLLNSSGTFPCSLSSVFQELVSCPPIASDETSILNFLKEKGDRLGCPLIYDQDIRVLRTDPNLKTEKHFFERSSKKDSHDFIYMNEILKCEDAYKLGYTTALRGMGFRCPGIAAISDELATLFGQPSTGANLYLTPPNSQGLPCHYDDHCVFICQLHGSKHWVVSPDPVVQLPRLYQHLENPSGATVESRHIVLREGDILYIPRGIPHEASTSMGRNGLDGAANFSLHLTLSVEIEPPFEWEGFAHTALHCWSYSDRNTPQSLATRLCSRMDVILISFMHVAIESLGNSDHVFRKACLIAADPLNADIKKWLDQNQRAIFNQLINKIYEVSNFTKVLESIRKTIQRSEDPFHQMRWLSILSQNNMNEPGWDFPFEGFNELFPLIDQHKDEFEAAFTNIKSKFCREVNFEDAERSFKMIHALYKKTRRQYVNGMLSLHS